MLHDDHDRKRLLTLYFLTLPEHLGPEAFADLFAQDVAAVLDQILRRPPAAAQQPYAAVTTA